MSDSGYEQGGVTPEPGIGMPGVDATQEEHRHQQVLELAPSQEGAIERLVVALGDRSWRVRRTALDVARERFARDARLVTALLEGMASEDNAGLRNACAEAVVEMGGLAVPTLARGIRALDFDLRKFCVEALGAIGTPSARDALLTSLSQPDINVAASVVEALGQIGGQEVIEVLTQRLMQASGDVQIAAYCLDALGRCSASLTFEALAPYLRQRSLLRFVYPLLPLTEDPRCLQPLCAGLADHAQGARWAATVSLARYLRRNQGALALVRQRLEESDVAIKGLERALESDRGEVTAAAVFLLGCLDEPERSPRLLSACAGRAFVRIGVDVVVGYGQAAVEPLLRAIDGADTESRLLYLEIVETVGNHTAAKKLLELAESYDAATSEGAIRALARVGGSDEVDPLIEFGRSDDPGIAQLAAFALSNIGSRFPDEVGEKIRRAIEDGDVLPVWFSVLGALARETDLDLLVAASAHQEPEVRCAVLEAAASFGVRFGQDALLAGLRDTYAPARAAAARAAGTVHTPAVVDALVHALDDPDAWVGGEAARALGALGAAATLPHLRRAARSPVGLVAVAALQGLSRLAPDDVKEDALVALGHADAEVAREAVNLSLRMKIEDAALVLAHALGHSAWEVRWAAAEAILKRGVPLELETARRCMRDETEPVVQEALERLVKQVGKQA